MKKLLLLSLPFILLATGCANSFNGGPNDGETKKQAEVKLAYSDEEPSFDQWDGTVATSFASGDGSVSNPYVINTAREFAYFRKAIASKSYYLDQHIVLNANIDLNNIDWPGIGGGTSAKSFKGYFDGNSKTIKNLKMTVESERKGLFNSNSGTISNLNIEGSLLGGKENSTCYGLFIGINYGNISNCTSKGDVNVLGRYVSGFIGCNVGGNISNCSYLDGYTHGTNCVGGIIGYNMASSGKIGSLISCKNYGTIKAEDYPNQNYSGLGGIIGTCGSGATIDHCSNYGNVIGGGKSVGGTGGIIGNNFNSAIIDSTNEGEVVAKEKVGGIVGHARNASNINNCINEGLVSGDIACAGIVGYCRANLIDCVNYGEIKSDENRISYWTGGIVGMLGSNVSVLRSINHGFVHGLGSSLGGVGGIVGSNYASTIKECTNHGFVQGLYRVGGILGYSQTTTGFVLMSTNHGDFKSIADYGTVSLGGIVGYNQATVIDCVNNGHYQIEDDVSIDMYGYIIGYDLSGESSVYRNINNA